MTEHADTTILAFGKHELDFGRRELREDGRPVELPPTPLRVLLYLAEHRDRAVPKNELMDTIWPDAIVTDTSLANALNQARLALGDDGTAQRVIRTQKGIGYRFVAECEVRVDEARSSEAEPARQQPGQPHSPIPPERRLAAILSADVVGYSRLMAEDEDATIRAVTARREEVELHVQQHRGRLVDFTGDNFLAEFGSAVEAVACAMEIQRLVAALNDDLAPERKMQFRMGLHLGEVQVQDGRLFGTGVNVAARLEGLAEPGGVCISEEMHREVAGRTRFEFRDLGDHEVKNIPKPVHAYAVDLPGASSTSPERRGGRGASRRRALQVAVVGIAVTALVAFVALEYRQNLEFWWAFNAPAFLLDRVDQEIAFTEASDGVRIAYAKSGSGPPLVLVVGWFTHLERGPIYDSPDIVGGLSTERTLVRYDGRGFGLSDRDVTDFSLDARVRDLEAVVDALGVEEVALYGASLGSATVIAYAAKHPNRVSHLIVAGATLGPGAMGFSSVGTAEEYRSQVALLRSGWERNNVRSLLAAAVTRGAAPDEIQTPQLADFLLISGDAATYTGWMEAIRDMDVSREAGRVRAPTLVIVGGDDLVFPVDHSRRLAALIENARVEILPDTSHIGTMRSPPAMRLVLDFLADTPAAAISPPTSLVVLPFDDMSPDGDQEYFAHGMSEELASALARVRELRVVGGTSAEVVKRRGLSVAEIGDELEVGALIEGSVRKAGSRLRITVQLISVADGFQLWSASYDRPLGDVFAVQEEIARSVSEALEVRLTGDVATYAQVDLRAYDFYLLGRHHVNRRGEEGLRRAIDYLDRALEIEPDHALANAELAEASLALGQLTGDDAGVRRAEAAAERAVATGAERAEAYAALAWVRYIQRDWSAADRACRRAIELNPGYARAHLRCGMVEVATGALADAVEACGRAVELDPFAAGSQLGLAMLYEIDSDYENAAHHFERSLKAGPDYTVARWRLVRALDLAGRGNQALQTIEQAHLPAEVVAVYADGWRQRGYTGFLEAQLKLAVETSGLSCTNIRQSAAYSYAYLGSWDLALECLGQAAEERRLLPLLRLDPVWDPVRDDPRFQAILEGMGLAD